MPMSTTPEATPVAMPIVAAFSEGRAADVPAGVVVAAACAVSVLEGRVCIVDVGSSFTVVDGVGVGVEVVVAVVEDGVVDDDVGIEGELVGRVCVRDEVPPAPKMLCVRLLIPDPNGSMMSEYSDCIGAARLLGSAEIRTSRALVGDGCLSPSVVAPNPVAEAGSDPESAPTCPIAVSR